MSELPSIVVKLINERKPRDESSWIDIFRTAIDIRVKEKEKKMYELTHIFEKVFGFKADDVTEDENGNLIAYKIIDIDRYICYEFDILLRDNEDCGLEFGVMEVKEIPHAFNLDEWLWNSDKRRFEKYVKINGKYYYAYVELTTIR